MSAETNAPTVQHAPRPPLVSKSTRRLSISFRKIKQTLGTITHVDIFTGSLTGTSERFAASLAEKAIQRGAIVSLKTLEEFDPECFYDPNGPHHSTSRVTVFVVSTHFAGGSSPNAEAFSQWLRIVSGDNSASLIDSSLDEETRLPNPTTSRAPVVKPSSPTSVASSPTTDSTFGGLRRLSQLAGPRTAPSPRRQSSFSAAIRPLLRMFNTGNGSAASSKPQNPLHGVQYGVFGVGNSMYLTYNAMGKFVDARLQAVGAVRLCPLGLGDVSNDIEDAFAKWETQLLQLLVNQKPGPPVDIAAEARQASFEQRRPISAEKLKTDQAIVPLTPIAPTPPASKTSSSEAKTPDDPSVLPRQTSFSGSSSSSVASSGSASKFCVRDHYGRYVRLRFRCRFVSTVLKADTGLSSLKLPPIAVPTEKTRVNYLVRRSSSIRRHATHIRHPCIALQSITMLKLTSTSTDSQANASAFKEVSLAKLAILDPELVFETADTFGYFPPNAKDIVETIGARLGLDMEAYVELSFHDDTSTSTAGQSTESEDSNNKDRHLLFPSPCKIRTILSDFLELRAISREFVRVASGFVTNPKEHELLENLASIDGSAAFTRDFGQASSGLIKLLELAPSLRMPFEVFVNITPLLKPRLYSIASSHLKNDREFEVVVALGNPNAAHGLAVSNFRRILSKSDVTLADNGLTSNSSGTIQDKAARSSSPGIRLLRGFITTSRFKTPADLSAPMILIANGIGVAPLRALLQHRELESGKSASDVAFQRLSNGKPNAVPVPLDTRSSFGKNLLLLGCANQASVLFESELRSWDSNGFLELHIVYSAEPGQPTQYVQDLVATQKQQIAAFMSSSPEARIYICGKVAMARTVNQILAVADTSDGGTSWYQKALQSGRYIEGIFG